MADNKKWVLPLPIRCHPTQQFETQKVGSVTNHHQMTNLLFDRSRTTIERYKKETVLAQTEETPAT
jgi:hypothetical protein